MLVWLGSLLIGVAASVLANLISSSLQTVLPWWQTALVALGVALLAFPALQKFQKSRSSRAQINQRIASEGNLSMGDTAIAGDNLGKASIKQRLKGSDVSIGDTSIKSDK